MSESKPKFYVTTPIYYVNARPHIGHAYTTIVADVLARRHRLLGDDTFFLTGTDEHGQKIERSAAAAGIPPQQFADQVSAQFETLWKRMGITNDRYIRTTDERHKIGVQKLFRELYDRGFIYLDKYTGAYCVSDEAFVDVQPGEPCPDCGRITEIVTEENFFFKLSAFQLTLLDLIESNQIKIENEARRNEVLSFLRGNVKTSQIRSDFLIDRDLIAPLVAGEILYSEKGNPYEPRALKDLSVSRSSFTWGIPVPEDVQKEAEATQKHVVYVWLDALANYMTAIGYGSDQPADEEEFQKFWPADLHLVGKEIIRFHCVYWPAFLLAAGLPLPKAITAHGWLLFDNAKMSKSKGNIVRTETILEAFGEHVYAKQFPESTKAERDLFASDVLRYFLLREIPFGQDGSFSFDAMAARYNADLVNGYGNLVKRVLTLIEREGGEFFAMGNEPIVESIYADTEDELLAYGTAGIQKLANLTTRLCFENLLLDRDSLGQIDFLRYSVDLYLSLNAPWKLDSTISEENLRLQEILQTAAESIRIITALLYPILPFATARVWAQLGLGDIEEAARNGELKNLQWGGLKPGTKLGPLAPIFPRADKGLVDIMIDMEEQNAAGKLAADNLAAGTANPRPEAPLKSAATPAPPAPVAADPTHPAAPPRAFDAPADQAALPVAGSSAVTTERVHTPHGDAQASGVFASQASQTPVASGPADATPQSQQITIDDFAKVELRVAQILIAERIPKADKLLRLEVDLGYEKRQILSGIAEWYMPEDLVGRRIVVITNLAPRKMRGLESHGMLLAASEGEGGKPVLATFGEDIALGSRLK